MKHSIKLAALASATAIVLAGCHGDFLAQGEASKDPNRPTVATNNQLLVGVEANLWSIWGSDPARATGIFAQQFTGAQSQYQSNIESYQITEDNTNGVEAGLYGGGGLVDVRKLEANTAAVGDSTFLGIAQIHEAALIGTGADLYGDLVYSQALKGTANPALDNQLTVYDSVQALLSRAIVNLTATGVKNVGPGAADFVFGGRSRAGERSGWTAVAHTLKARFYMHTAEVRGTQAYQAALSEAKLGIASDADNYVGVFNQASGQQNFYYQFEVTAGRAGYVIPNAKFVALLDSRSDPRRNTYFNADGTDISAMRLAPDFQQPFVSYDENTLIWAEAAYRTRDEVTALAKLNEERIHNGLAGETVAGRALLGEILTEKYIVDFQLGEEAWNDYKRTCYPNLTPTGQGPIPGRFYYDAGERQTNTSIPKPGTGVNTLRNRNDPVNTIADATGAACNSAAQTGT